MPTTVEFMEKSRCLGRIFCWIVKFYMLIHIGVGHASVAEIPLLVFNQLIIT